MRSKVTARLANFKLDLFSIIAFVLGLSFLQGVVYITKVGNLYVDIAYLVGALAFIIRAISDPKGTVDKLEHYFFSRPFSFSYPDCCFGFSCSVVMS